MQADMLSALLRAAVRTVSEHAPELTALDQAIGDGDHGLNMKRGFERIGTLVDEIAKKPLPDALNEIGKVLVLTVGGASGPLYGTFFMALGHALPEEPGRAELASAFDAAVAAVEKRGKSTAGQKTLLDVLVPVGEELRRDSPDLVARIRQRAVLAADATIPMRAQRGRASFLGERSIGHMDPGARSCSLLVITLCDFLGG
jgi:phosphoenolpyruvate---glycerone phosphotransferase subunit DhaL